MPELKTPFEIPAAAVHGLTPAKEDFAARFAALEGLILDLRCATDLVSDIQTEAALAADGSGWEQEKLIFAIRIARDLAVKLDEQFHSGVVLK